MPVDGSVRRHRQVGNCHVSVPLEFYICDFSNMERLIVSIENEDLFIVWNSLGGNQNAIIRSVGWKGHYQILRFK